MADPVSEWRPLLAVMRPDMVRLSAYAVEFRYPGESANEDDAKSAVEIMKRSRLDFRQIV